jgi:hypothetical protein
MNVMKKQTTDTTNRANVPHAEPTTFGVTGRDFGLGSGSREGATPPAVGRGARQSQQRVADG